MTTDQSLTVTNQPVGYSKILKGILSTGGSVVYTMFRDPRKILDLGQRVREACNVGFDGIVIDTEHIMYWTEDRLGEVIYGCRKLGMQAIIRVPQGCGKYAQLLDSGLHGILLPNVKYEEDVVYARNQTYIHHPDAREARAERGVGALEECCDWQDIKPPESTEYINAESLLYVQIESEFGMKNAASMAAVNGVTGFIFGPYDYATDMGIIERGVGGYGSSGKSLWDLDGMEEGLRLLKAAAGKIPIGAHFVGAIDIKKGLELARRYKMRCNILATDLDFDDSVVKEAISQFKAIKQT